MRCKKVHTWHTLTQRSAKSLAARLSDNNISEATVVTFHRLRLQCDLAYQWQANQRKKGQNWKKRTSSDHPAPQRSLTASRRLWRIPASSRIGLRLAQYHRHPGAQRPRLETDQLEEPRHVHHCSSELYMKLTCVYSGEDRELFFFDLLAMFYLNGKQIQLFEPRGER